MIDSPLWNIFFFAVTAAMMGYAYYSQHEYVQKLALFTFGSWVLCALVVRTPYAGTVYVAVDMVGMAYVLYLLSQAPHVKVIQWIAFIYVCFLTMHMLRSENTAWLIYQIAGNVLYVAQCGTLCKYGKNYGRAARCNPADKPRTDPFHRFSEGILARWNLLNH